VDVLIIEIKSGKLAAKIPVILQGMNYAPSEREYFEEAWRCAVEDKTVDANLREKYSFQLVRP